MVPCVLSSWVMISGAEREAGCYRADPGFTNQAQKVGISSVCVCVCVCDMSEDW